VPTRRAIALAAIGLAPAVLTVLSSSVGWLLLAFDAALVVLVAIDWLRAPRVEVLRLAREVEPVISSGARTPVRLLLTLAPGARPVRGELREAVPPGPKVESHRQGFELSEAPLTLTWWLTPNERGDLALGDVHVRLSGPWGLALRQGRVSIPQRVQVFPDLSALTRDALSLARAREDQSRRTLRRISEGREFDSLREYRPGDDRRNLDWKATARRGRPMVREHRPERNQLVLLLIDCGRHMAGHIGGRPKIEHAVDAALRVAKVSLDEGDLVGVMAFSTSVLSWMPPRKGPDAMAAITRQLYSVRATLDESDYGRAFDTAFARGSKRALVLVFTDLLDASSSAALIRRTLKLVPRHLPLVASLADAQLHELLLAAPVDAEAAAERVIAARLEDEHRHTVARLRDAGARVIRSTPAAFGPQVVNAYLEIKGRGLL